MGGGKHGIALIGLFNGPVSSAVVAVYALGVPGFIGELMRNPARASFPLGVKTACRCEDSPPSSRSRWRCRFYLKVGEEVPVVVQGQRPLRFLSAAVKVMSLSLSSASLFFAGSGSSLLGCHGKHRIWLSPGSRRVQHYSGQWSVPRSGFRHREWVYARPPATRVFAAGIG